MSVKFKEILTMIQIPLSDLCIQIYQLTAGCLIIAQDIKGIEREYVYYKRVACVIKKVTTPAEIPEKRRPPNVFSPLSFYIIFSRSPIELKKEDKDEDEEKRSECYR